MLKILIEEFLPDKYERYVNHTKTLVSVSLSNCKKGHLDPVHTTQA
jgi:hypothetical protein